MAMSNAELEVALKSGLQRLVTALANKVAPDSLLLEGKSLAEITSLILAGKAATAGTADNALAVGGKDLTTLESERNAQLVAAIDALRIELEGDISNVTAESLGLGNVVNYGIATEEEALAGAVDKYVTAALAVKIAQVKIDEIVNAAPETLNTLSEIAAALNNDPDVINTLMSNIGTNATAIEALETATAAFEAKVLSYFDVDGNANNANLLAGKTLDEVLALARDGVDMSNVVLKTDDFGPYTVALASDVTTEEVQVPVWTLSSQYVAQQYQVIRSGGNTALYELSGTIWNDVTVNQSAEVMAALNDSLDAMSATDGVPYYGDYTLETTNREVVAPASSLKVVLDSLEAADKAQVAVTEALDAKVEQNATATTEALALKANQADVDAAVDGINTALSTKVEQNATATTEALALKANQADVDAAVDGINTALSTKVEVGSNIATNTLLVGEGEGAAEVALSQIIADINAAIAAGGAASTEGLADLQAALDAFIAAKATGEEAIAGTDNVKYITALALKAAIAELESRAVLDGEHVSTNLVTFDHQDLVPKKIIWQFGTQLPTSKDGQELWSVVRNAGVDTISMSTDGVTFNPLPPLEMFPEEQRPVYEALFTELSVWVDDAAVADGTVLYAVTEDRMALGPVSKVDVLLKDVLSVLETKAAQSLEAYTRIFDDLSYLKDGVEYLADMETGKLDATAQAVDSAKLEGKSVADLTASSADGIVGVATDKFMTPAASRDAFDARWAEKVGAAPETLDTIEEIAAALRNNPDSLAAVETVAKQYTDAEVLAAIQQISGVDMVAGTTLASLYAQVVALQASKLDATATAVNSEKLGGKSLMEVIDSAIQPGRLFYPVVHVNGSLAEDNYVMPTPADVWAQVKTNAVMEQVDTIYAVGVKRLLPGNLLALTNQEGMTLRGAVSEAQEGPGYVIMRAGIEDTEWTVITDPLLGCVARLSKHCVVVGDNTERFVPGQTLFYNGFEALSENVYYDWTLMADKEWEVATFTGTDLLIDSARYHRSEIRIQSTGPVTVTFDVPTDLPYEMEVRFVNQTGVEVTFAGSNVMSVPRMQQYTLTKVNGVVRAVRYTNTSVALAGDMDEAFFVNPDYSAPQV